MPALTALIVDDSAAMRRQVRAALATVPGLASSEAADGAEAWRLLAAGAFDLLVTDINMPRLDGLKLVSLVRRAGAHRTIPIVVVTTEGAEEDRRRAMALGADAYLLKPVEAERLLAVIRDLLRRG